MGGLELTWKANIEARPERIARAYTESEYGSTSRTDCLVMGGLELTWKANSEARPARIARLWQVWSLPGKRISKHVPNGLPGYGRFGAYLESEYRSTSRTDCLVMGGLELTWKANSEARPEQIARLWGVWSLPGKRISKHVPNGLLGYGRFGAYLESEYRSTSGTDC